MRMRIILQLLIRPLSGSLAVRIRPCFSVAMQSLIIIGAIITSTFGELQSAISKGPLNATAIVGDTASFECILSSTSLFPRWNINGTDFTVTNLPVGFDFESNSYSKVLTINPVRQEMNKSLFSCSFMNERRVHMPHLLLNNTLCIHNIH